MKFVIAAVVVLAAAMGVQSSVVAGIPGLGLGINGLGLGVSNLGLVNGLGLGINTLGLGIPAGIISPAQIPAAVNIASSPLISAAQIPGAINIAGAGIIKSAQIPAAVNIASSPLISAAQIPAAVAVAPQAALIGHEATYVAKTRGAIHTAPLAGHIKSAASINVAPAPGTW